MNFNTKTASKVTGITLRKIDYWDRTHFIKPSVSEASGYGSVRLYSFNDLIQLKVAKTLLDKGVTLQKIRKAINYFKKHMPEIRKPLSELRFLTDGETIFVITKNKKEIIDTLKSGQLVFSIALGELIEDIEGEVVTFQEEKEYKVTVKGKKYNVILHIDTEDSGYWVECPSLPGCSSRGDTIEEALQMIKDSIKGHLEVAMNEKINAIKSDIFNAIPGCNIEYQFSNEFHEFCIKSDKPTCWLYIDRNYVDDYDKVSLINLVRIYRIEEWILKGDKSYWFYLDDEGLQKVDENFTKSK